MTKAGKKAACPEELPAASPTVTGQVRGPAEPHSTVCSITQAMGLRNGPRLWSCGHCIQSGAVAEAVQPQALGGIQPWEESGSCCHLLLREVSTTQMCQNVLQELVMQHTSELSIPAYLLCILSCKTRQCECSEEAETHRQTWVNTQISFKTPANIHINGFVVPKMYLGILHEKLIYEKQACIFIMGLNGAFKTQQSSHSRKAMSPNRAWNVLTEWLLVLCTYSNVVDDRVTLRISSDHTNTHQFSEVSFACLIIRARFVHDCFLCLRKKHAELIARTTSTAHTSAKAYIDLSASAVKAPSTFSMLCKCFCCWYDVNPEGFISCLAWLLPDTQRLVHNHGTFCSLVLFSLLILRALLSLLCPKVWCAKLLP